jgi:hypothetical protein
MSSPERTPESKTHRILSKSDARLDDAQLPFPLRWIVQLIQRLIAVMFIVVANAVKMVFSSETRPHGAGRHQMEIEAKKALGHTADRPLEARDLLPPGEGKED